MTTKKTIEEEIREGVQSVLNGERIRFKHEFGNPALMNEILNSLGGTDNDDLDTNGWDWSYWYSYTVNGKIYKLRGSGFYGGITISIP